MDRKSFSDMHCSVAQCLEVVGEWWSLLIVRDAFLGVRRFDEFQLRLGISRNILNQRLAHLVETGVLTKVPYSEHPPRFEYRLTRAATFGRWSRRCANGATSTPRQTARHSK